MVDPLGHLQVNDLFRFFEPATHVDAVTISESAIPEPYRQLLVHPHHMTVTVERYFGGPVNVVVLDRHQVGGVYARKILLTLADTGQVVQFGIVRIRLELCNAPVRAAILAEKTPLGRILIDHDVMRRIEPTEYLRIRTDDQLTSYFVMDIPEDVWGRLAVIHCDNRPAIELLEILAPVGKTH